MARRSGFRPVAIVLVLQDDNGRQMMIGSQQVDSASVEMSQDIYDYADGPVMRYMATGGYRMRIEADCHGGVIQHSEPIATPIAIEQRGIYLPNMSFRALPAPKEDAK